MGAAVVTGGWEDSAAAWIADMGDHGDFGRQFVLDDQMMKQIQSGAFVRALDVGCGEGRFCRMMKTLGLETVGVDPTQAMIDQARLRDPEGDYQIGVAEQLAFEDGEFDLVVSYLSLIDIAELDLAISQMVRVLRPGGVLLIANLSAFITAGMELGWRKGADGQSSFSFDHYLKPRSAWVTFGNAVRVENWHRPLSTYMSLLLSQGLILRQFLEPEPTGGDPGRVARYRRAPWFIIMEWEKPDRGF